MASLTKRPAECRILIVDDEEATRLLLVEALTPYYRLTAARSFTEAASFIETTDFDVVVTDLRLPDRSGLEILSLAKGKDAYTEVVVITGYASLESATLAMNLGATSYIEKPIVLADFQVQIEKAVASRLFHMKSISLMQQSDDFSPEIRDHLTDITALYYFTRKLTLSLEIGEIMRITLEEMLRKSGALFCTIAVRLHGFSELHAMPRAGAVDASAVRSLLLANWDHAAPQLDREAFAKGVLEPVVYKGKQDAPPSLERARAEAIPMLVAGSAIGTLTAFHAPSGAPAVGEINFLFIISSIVAPLIEHGYTVLETRRLATTDGLTGIANHRFFHEALLREISRSKRTKTGFALLMFDLDDFKLINDTYGHLVGDAVLKDVVGRVLENVRAIDTFARYGGEEFFLILPETNALGAEVLAKRIMASLSSHPLRCAHQSIAYTVSMGITVYNAEHPESKDGLIAQADSAMYASKTAGKNRYTLHAACL